MVLESIDSVRWFHNCVARDVLHDGFLDRRLVPVLINVVGNLFNFFDGGL
jgi:hypothetical protein